MQLENMRSAHKITVYAAWVCSAILTLLSVRQYGFSKETIITFGILLSTSIIVTLLRIAKFNEVWKASIIVTCIGFATLLTSIFQGGNPRCFIASFFVLGLATLYFKSKVIIAYGIAYTSACVIAVFINPAYIDGPAASMASILIKLVIYAALTVVLSLATGKGEKMLRASEADREAIAAAAQQRAQISSNLTNSMETSQEAMDTLNKEVSAVMMQAQEMANNSSDSLNAANSLNQSAQQISTQMEHSMDQMAILVNSFKTMSINAEEGLTQSNIASTAMEQANDSVTIAMNDMNSLMKEMTEITRLLADIESVASETNLLAVNASIEAARVGAAGKGFAVVAGEVRTLASRTAAMADEISNIVSSISNTSRKVYESVEHGEKCVLQGKSCLQNLENTVSAMNTSIHDSNAIVTQHQSTIQETNSAMIAMTVEVDQISHRSRDISERANQISAAVQKQNASTAQISTQFHEINNMASSLCSE